MAEAYKRLGAIAPTDNKEYLLYTAPDGTQSLISNITVANRSSSPASFDINVYPDGISEAELSASTEQNNVVAIGQASNSAYSTDGVSWTLGTALSSINWNDVAYGDGIFVAVPSSGSSTAVSTDGINWSSGGSLQISAVYNVTSGNGKFVAVSTYSGTGTVFFSTDGSTWLNYSGATGYSAMSSYSITYGDGKFVVLEFFGTSVQYNTDPSSVVWSSSTLPSSNAWYNVTYGNGKFVAVAHNTSTYAYSTDAITWTQGNLGPTPRFTDVAWSEDLGYFAVVGNNQVYLRSTDGISWFDASMSAGIPNGVKSISSVTLGSTPAFYVVGDNAFAYITDPTSFFTNVTAPANTVWEAVVGGIESSSYVSPSLNNLYKTSDIAANSTEILEPGIALAAQGAVVVKDNSGGNLTFSTYGVELS